MTKYGGLLAMSVLAACGTVTSGDQPDAGGGGEICTPAAAGAVVADDDGDGAIDEGCSWTLATAHAMPPLLGVAWQRNLVTPTWISSDGRSLYLTYGADFGQHTALYVVRRASRSARFGAPELVVGDDLGNYSVGGLTLSSDGLEAYFEAETEGSARTDIYRATRATADGRFGKLVRVEALSTAADDERPALAADGLELWLAQDRRLQRSVRTSTTAPFVAAEPLLGIPDGEVNGPAPSLDGRSLFYYLRAGDRYRVMRADRADPTTAIYGESSEVVALEVTGMHETFLPVLSQATQELFFSSRQPWSPTYYALWRARICRDGACPTSLVDCVDGVRSADGLHCYTKLPAAQTRATAATACAQIGGHLVTIGSSEEQAVVWGARAAGGDTVWMGSYDDRAPIGECNTTGIDGSLPFPCSWGWDTGEAWTYASWYSNAQWSEPEEGGEQDCAVLSNDPGLAGHWADISCDVSLAAVCETEVFPTW